MKLLVGYAWPGNVRELKSAMESAIVACHGWVIQRSTSKSKTAPPAPHRAAHRTRQ